MRRIILNSILVLNNNQHISLVRQRNIKSSVLNKIKLLGERQMSIVRYQPWNRLQASAFQNELSHFFTNHRGAAANSDNNDNSQSKNWVPAVDIRETEEAFILHSDIPGVRLEDISVDLENGLLTIKGERTSTSTEDSDSYTRIERFSGEFERKFNLPDSANPEKVSARYNDGVLVVSISKKAALQARKIKIEH